MNDYVEVVFCIDDAYALPASVTMRSILATTRRAVRFHVVDGGITPSSVEKLVASGGPNVRILAPRTVARDLNESHLSSYWSGVILRRLELHELLPDIDRVLSLDADLLVRDDIGLLWDQGVRSDCPMRMALATLAPFGYSGLYDRGFGRRTAYFNCGVMDLNLTVLRRRMREAAETLHKFPDFLFPEMDAFNVAFQNEIDRIEARWHVQLHSYYRMFGPGASPAELGGLIEEDEARAASENPALVHFLERWKPWHADSQSHHGELAKEWTDHARATVWRDTLPAFGAATMRSRLKKELSDVLRPVESVVDGRSLVEEVFSAR
jgi:lipopolysaccharide biosynthesis glycosyltransferase